MHYLVLPSPNAVWLYENLSNSSWSAQWGYFVKYCVLNEQQRIRWQFNKNFHRVMDILSGCTKQNSNRKNKPELPKGLLKKCELQCWQFFVVKVAQIVMQVQKTVSYACSPGDQAQLNNSCLFVFEKILLSLLKSNNPEGYFCFFRL